jgi:hypothetical protein
MVMKAARMSGLLLAIALLPLAGANGFAKEKRSRVERQPVPEFPYAANPQYQYPRTDGRTDLKCPAGQKPFQGKCREIRWLPIEN